MPAPSRSCTLLAALAFATLVPGKAPAQVEKQSAARPETLAPLETVATFNGPMPTGVAVSRSGRVFVCFPRWGDRVENTVVEIKNGQATKFPAASNQVPAAGSPADWLISVQSVVVDANDHLWILDTGSVEFKPPPLGGAKLIEVDLATDAIVRKILFPDYVIYPSTYLNDVRIDLRRGLAYVTDSSDRSVNGIVVVDLASGRCWRRLDDHPTVKAQPGMLPFVEGHALRERPADGPEKPLNNGADGLALSADGSRLFFCALASRTLASVSTDALADPSYSDDRVASTVQEHGEKGASDGMESDAQGRLYLTEYEQNAIVRRTPDGRFETLAHDPRLLWPDTLALGANGYLYVIANQLHRQPRFNGGVDLRQKPYHLFRLKVGGTPVRPR